MTILRYVLLSLAILILAAIGVRTLGLPHAMKDGPAPAPQAKAQMRDVVVASVPSAAQTLTDARRAVQQRLDEVPQFASFYKDLGAAFPRLYASLLDRSARAVSGGAAPPSPGAMIWDALRSLQQSNGILAAGADQSALAMFFDARLSMLDVLATVDTRLCADFLYGTMDPSIEDFSTAHRDLVADMAGKQLAAIEDGQRRHLNPGSPSSEDLDLVSHGLEARKLSPEEISVLLDGKPSDPPLPEARLCEIGRTYLSVLKELPPVVRQRVYGFTAELLARS